MKHGLADAPEHQADAHSRAEQHGKPGQGGELGLGVVTTDANLPETAEGEIESSQDEHVGHENQEPARRRGDYLHGGLKELACVLLEHQGQQNKADQYKGGHEGDVGM